MCKSFCSRSHEQSGNDDVPDARHSDILAAAQLCVMVKVRHVSMSKYVAGPLCAPMTASRPLGRIAHAGLTRADIHAHFSLFRHILCMMHMLHQHDSEPQERWIVIYCNTTMDQMDRNSCLPMVALHRRGVPGPSSTRGHGIARCQPIARMNPDHILRKHGRQQCRHLHHVLQHLQSVNCLKKSTYGTDCVLVLHAGDTDRSQMQPCSASRHPFDCHQRYGAGFS